MKPVRAVIIVLGASVLTCGIPIARSEQQISELKQCKDLSCVARMTVHPPEELRRESGKVLYRAHLKVFLDCRNVYVVVSGKAVVDRIYYDDRDFEARLVNDPKFELR